MGVNYCPSCSVGKLEAAKKDTRIKYKGNFISYIQENLKCCDCGECFTTDEMDDVNLSSIKSSHIEKSINKIIK